MFKTISCCVLTAFVCVSTVSAQVTVAPSRLEMPAKARAVSIKFSNDDSTPKTYDILVFDWIGNTDAGQPNLGNLPTTDIVSKPRITIQPGQTKDVRFMVQTRKDSAASFYRILLNDITPPQVVDSSEAEPKSANVNFVINRSLPLVVLNKQNATGRLELSNGTLKNSGDKHVRLITINSISQLAYLLPGESRPACFKTNLNVCTPVTSLSEVSWTDKTY